MNKNCIKDDELSKVNGGTREQILDLRNAFGISDIDTIKSRLLVHGIIAELYDNQCGKNTYENAETGEPLRHEQVIELIKKNRWY